MSLFKRTENEIKIQAEKNAWQKYEKALNERDQKHEQQTSRNEKLKNQEIESLKADHEKEISKLKDDQAFELRVRDNEVKLKVNHYEKKTIELQTKIDNVDRVYSELTARSEQVRVLLSGAKSVAYGIRKNLAEIVDIEKSLDHIEYESKQIVETNSY